MRPPGSWVQGAGSNKAVFINDLEDEDAAGNRLHVHLQYNSKYEITWKPMANAGIDQMQNDIPLYLKQRVPN